MGGGEPLPDPDLGPSTQAGVKDGASESGEVRWATLEVRG
jgi:hypothetical protein